MENLFKCGHSIMGNGISCPMCGCSEKIDCDSLVGRKAKCSQCGDIVDSNYDLPFFFYAKDKPYDSYYCGCKGFD